jgi:hypothetical protein
MKKYAWAEALRIGINIDCTIAEAVRSGITTDDNLAKLFDRIYSWPQHVLKNWSDYSREARLLAAKLPALDLSPPGCGKTTPISA